MINKDLLSILACPHTKGSLSLISEEHITELNELIAKQKLTNKEGKPVLEKIDAAVTTSDYKFVYPIRNSIPVMLVEESFDLSNHIRTPKNNS